MNIENKKEERKDKKSFLEWVKEILYIIKVFVVPYKALDGVEDVPKELKKKGNILGMLVLMETIIALVFSFMLKATNMLIEHKLVVAGMLIFMLYKAEKLISNFSYNFRDIERKNYTQTFNDKMTSLGMTILGKTTDRVFRYDKTKGYSSVMENEPLINSIKRYEEIWWEYQINHKFDVIEVCSIIVMMILVIVTNQDIPNLLFIPFVCLFFILTFGLSVYNRLCWKNYVEKDREYKDERDVIVNDMLRVKSIIPKDVEMRISKFKIFSEKNVNNIKVYSKSQNKVSLILSAFELSFQYIVIIFYWWTIKDIGVESIAIITANIAVLMTALNKIRGLASSLSHNSEQIESLEAESEDFEQILNVYKAELQKCDNDEPVDRIEIQPFKLKYEKKEETDIPFTLECKETMVIEKGEVIVFSGVSGSGKSTVMKMLMDRVRVGKNVDIPNTRRFLFFDETLAFGSLSIYEEFFADCEVHLQKAYDILSNLHLAQELKFFSPDIMKAWMKKNFYSSSMSHGQKQRMVLAKLLYHLDDNIDGLLLDEVTSGLDENADEGMDVQKMLEYCVRYANSDRKRIVLLSIHQSIEGVKESLIEDGYCFKTFEFKDGEVKLKEVEKKD